MPIESNPQLNLFDHHLRKSRYSIFIILGIIAIFTPVYFFRQNIKTPKPAKPPETASSIKTETHTKSAKTAASAAKTQTISEPRQTEQLTVQPEPVKKNILKPVEKTVEKTGVWEGQYSPFITHKFTVIRDISEWESAWAQLNLAKSQKDPLPEVDFSRNLVLALFLGQQNTGGYSVIITRLEYGSEKVTAYYRITRPGEGMMLIQTLTQPYSINKVKYSPLPFTFIEE